MLTRLIDKIFFAFGAIVFLQLPHFIDQYTQRIGGYAASQQAQLADYQRIANQHTNGDLTAYILRLENSQDPAIQDSAGQIQDLIDENQSLSQEVTVYESEPLWYQLPYFIGNMRMDLVRGTFQNFSPGVPINLWAWGYGLLGGLLFSMIFTGLTKTPALLKRKSKSGASAVNQ